MSHLGYVALAFASKPKALRLRPDSFKRNARILKGGKTCEKWKAVLFLVISFPLYLNMYLCTFYFLCVCMGGGCNMLGM